MGCRIVKIEFTHPLWTDGMALPLCTRRNSKLSDLARSMRQSHYGLVERYGKEVTRAPFFGLCRLCSPTNPFPDSFIASQLPRCGAAKSDPNC